jgi:hypothetical protein
MSCGEFKEIKISTEEKKVDEENKCFFINLCYYSNVEDVNPFTCHKNTTKFAFIPYNPTFLKLFPKDYSKPDIIGKIYSFEIEFIKLIHLQDNWYHRLTSKTTNNSSTLICYFIFSDGVSNNYREEFECFKNSINPKGEILDIKEIDSQLFDSRCVRKSDDQIIIKKIDYISRIKSPEIVVPGFSPIKAGSKKRKNNKTKKNKKRKSVKKKNYHSKTM